MATGSDHKQIVRRWLEAWNTRDANQMDPLADQFFTPDFTLHAPRMPNPVRGVTGVKHYVRNVLKDTPDMQVSVKDLFGEGDEVASRFAVRGTNLSTSQAGELPVIVIWRFAAGKIAEAWQHPGYAPATTS